MQLTGKQYGMMVSLTVLSLAGVLLLLWAWNGGESLWAKFAILLVSSGYLAVAITAAPWRSGYGRAVLAAVAFCWMGDQFGPGNFSFGVLMYVFCHFCLITAFVLYGISLRRFLAATAFMALVSLVVTLWVGPHIPAGERMMILGYMGIITLMMLFAGAVLPPGHLLILLGVGLFYISDLWLARNIYVQPGAINRNIGYPLYYAACLVLAWCAGLRPPARVAAPQPDML